MLATIDFPFTLHWMFAGRITYAEWLLYREFTIALFNRDLWLRCKTSGTYIISLGCC